MNHKVQRIWPPLKRWHPWSVLGISSTSLLTSCPLRELKLLQNETMFEMDATFPRGMSEIQCILETLWFHLWNQITKTHLRSLPETQTAHCTFSFHIAHFHSKFSLHIAHITPSLKRLWVFGHFTSRNAVHKKIGQYNFDRNVSVFLNSWFCLFIRNFSLLLYCCRTDWAGLNIILCSLWIWLFLW